MKMYNTMCALFAGTLGVGLMAGTAGAAIQFQTGNIQYTNVNIATDSHGFLIQGEVDATGLLVDFRGFGTGPAYTPIELHGQNGVAFVEAFNPTESLFKLTVSAPTGWAFADFDWKLDAVPPNDGSVTFMALDAFGMQIPLGAGTDTFFFDHNGQNPFHAHADAGTPISTLIITSTVPILDMKQVSVDLVPAPGAVGTFALGMLMATRRRRV